MRVGSREETMCMRVERRYKGKGRTLYVGGKVFLLTHKELHPQFQHRDMTFKHKCWNGPTRRPGFHVWKKRPCYRNYPYVIKKVVVKGLLGQSSIHYTARYLWVN